VAQWVGGGHWGILQKSQPLRRTRPNLRSAEMYRQRQKRRLREWYY
jgi:hypothetical protein